MKFLKNTLYFLIILSLTVSISCSKRLDLEPAIGLSSVDVYKNADNYVNVLAKLYAGMSLSDYMVLVEIQILLVLMKVFLSTSEFYGIFKIYQLIMPFVDGMM